MLYLITVILFFILSIILHIFFCRFKKGKVLYAKFFVLIALINLWMCVSVFERIKNIVEFNVPSLGLLPLQGTAMVIYLLLIPAYLVIYVTTQLQSPSKTILQLLSAHDGLTIKDLQKNFTDEAFIISRLNELFYTGCVKRTDKAYRLGASGRLILIWLNFYRCLLGARKRG